MASIPFTWELLDSTFIIDVRSEIEFEKGHIPGAVNVPILNTEERKIVGITFKKLGQQHAVLKGLELSGPNLSKRLKLAVKLSKNSQNIVVYCWRGGMRSSFFTFLMEFYGINVSVIKGGYKSYRKQVLKSFESTYNFSILSGMTGSAKTTILHELDKINAFSIDLEGLANHRGSSFGALGMAKQPSQEQFENNLSHCLIKVGKQKCWIEDESRTVGATIIPEGIWNQMRKAPHYFLDKPFDIRLDQIMLDYGIFSKEELQSCMERISKRLGPQNTKNAISLLQSEQFREAFSIALTYYDKAYAYHREINPLGKKIQISCNSTNNAEIAQHLFKLTNGE